MRQIPTGAKGSCEAVITPQDLANSFKDPSLPAVLATPVMLVAKPRKHRAIAVRTGLIARMRSRPLANAADAQGNAVVAETLRFRLDNISKRRYGDSYHRLQDALSSRACMLASRKLSSASAMTFLEVGLFSSISRKLVDAVVCYPTSNTPDDAQSSRLGLRARRARGIARRGTARHPLRCLHCSYGQQPPYEKFHSLGATLCPKPLDAARES
jgi:hypothetical protein